MLKGLRTKRSGLLALNAGLLIVAGGLAIDSAVFAQPGVAGPTRAPGDYALVGGSIPGANSNAVYVLDAANRELVAVRWDPSTRGLVGIGFRDLASDATGRTSR